MAAIIVIAQKSGQPYTATEVAKPEFYFLSIDDNIADSIDYPIEISPTKTVYSYEVWLRFRCDVAPDNQVDNFKIWTTGTLPSGQRITINSTAVTEYQEPTDQKSTQGTRTSITDYTDSNKLSIGGTLTAVGDHSDFMVFQLEVDAGVDPAEYDFTIFYSYDEY